jgi:DNA-binding transcriptional ArsR family regulator
MSERNVVVASDKDWHFSVSKNFVCNNKLSIGARLLMVVLRSFVGFKEDSCFPGRDHLCDLLDVNKDTLTKWMKELKDAGYVDVDQKKNNSRFGHNVYITRFHPCLESSDTKSQDTKPSDTPDSPLRYTTIKHVPSPTSTIEKKEDSPSEKSSPFHTEFIAGWDKKFSEMFGCKYRFNGRDGKAVKELKKLNMTAEDLLAIAEYAWENFKADRFYGPHSKTVYGFLANFNHFQTEAAQAPSVNRFGLPE